MRFLCLVTCVFVGLISFSSCLPEPPSNNNQGWGQQQQQQPQQSQGWGQPQQQPQEMQGGWGGQPQMQQQEPQSGGWGQPQMQEMQSGWGQGQSDGGQQSGGQKGKGGINWGFNFALGHQGDNNKGGGGGGDKGGGAKGGGGGGGVGWSSMPETNVKKPSIGDIFRTIIGIPKEVFNLLKESGLWILFLPLIVLIPLVYLAYSAGRFFGGVGHGWGWDKRSKSSWMNDEWQALTGFLKDPAVHKAAKGFMDEFVAKRIIKSVEEPIVLKKSS